MRYVLMAGFIALAMLLAFPGAVSAAETDTATVEVSGTIGAYIDINVLNPTISLGAMSTSAPATASTTLEVDTSFASWGVDASDESASDKGYMKAGTAKLFNKFDINNGGAYRNIDVVWTDFFSGNAPGVDMPNPVNVQQSITATDVQGTYSITITFTGASN
jgi:hypothetical protein